MVDPGTDYIFWRHLTLTFDLERYFIMQQP